MPRTLLASGNIPNANFLEISPVLTGGAPIISSSYSWYELILRGASCEGGPINGAILEVDVSMDGGATYDHDNCSVFPPGTQGGRYTFVWAAIRSLAVVCSANTNDAEVEVTPQVPPGELIDGTLTLWNPLASGLKKKFMFDYAVRNSATLDRIIGAGLYRGSNGAPGPVNAIRLSWHAYWDANWPNDCTTRNALVKFATGGRFSFYGNT